MNCTRMTTQLAISAARLCRSLRALKQPLHHQLIGAVAGGGQEAAAGQSGPEGIRAREELHIRARSGNRKL